MEPVLVYTDEDGMDVGAVSEFSLDLEFGLDGQSQDFEATFAGPRLAGGETLYIDATEYGGIVDQVETLSTSEAATYRGRTWHGVLACKVVRPDAGKDYLEASGDLNACIAAVVSRLGLQRIFRARTAPSGMSVSGYRYARYADAYTALTSLCESVGAVLCMRHSASTSGGRVELWAEPLRTSGTDEADSDVMEVGITANHRVVNHLVCLGEGELAARTVVDLYADTAGTISRTQSLFGADEVAEVYDYSNASSDELVEQGTKRLAEYQVQGSVTADALEAAGYGWRVGDRLAAVDYAHDRQVTAPVTGVVVKVSRGVLTCDYDVGDAEGAVGSVLGPSSTAAGKAAQQAAQAAQQALSDAYRAGELASEAVTSATKSYAAGDTSGPVGEWSDEPPEWRDGGVLWERLEVAYADGTEDVCPPSVSNAEWATPAQVESAEAAAADAAAQVTELAVTVDAHASTLYETQDQLQQTSDRLELSLSMVEASSAAALEAAEQAGGRLDAAEQAIASASSEAAAATEASQQVASALQSETAALREEFGSQTAVSAWMRVGLSDSGEPALSLGRTGDPMGMQLTNSQLSFVESGTPVAWVGAQALHVTRAEVTDTLSFGDFAWVPRENGNMSLKWMG